MRTLHFGLRVADLERSIAFYTAIGYEVLGDVPATELGTVTMLKLPADEFVALELVHDPTQGTGRARRPQPFRDSGRRRARHGGAPGCTRSSGAGARIARRFRRLLDGMGH